MNATQMTGSPGTAKKGKKLLALFLTLCMVLGMMPAMTIGAAAADGDLVIPESVDGIYTRTTSLNLYSGNITYYKAGDTVGEPTGSANPMEQSIPPIRAATQPVRTRAATCDSTPATP